MRNRKRLRLDTDLEIIDKEVIALLKKDSDSITLEDIKITHTNTFSQISIFLFNSHFIEINLSHIEFKNFPTERNFFRIVGSLPSLSKLNLQHSSFVLPQLISLFYNLQTNKTFQDLNVSHVSGHNNSAIDKKYFSVSIRNLLLRNKNILTLNLSMLYLNSANMAILAEALRGNSTLLTLDLNYNNIGNSGAIALFKALDNPHCGLITLNLPANDNYLFGKGEDKIIDPAIIALSNFIASNKSLTDLNLTSCPMVHTNYFQYQPFLKALLKNSTLQRIKWNFSSLAFVDEDAPILEELLSSNKTLTYFDFKYVTSTVKVLTAFINGLNNNNTLQAVHIDGTLLTNDLRDQFINIAKKNPNLTEMIFSNFSNQCFEKVVEKNKNFQERAQHNWRVIAPVISFFRANAKHPFRDSIIPVAKHLIRPLLRESQPNI